MKKTDPLKPSPSLLIKLGSAMIHAEEMLETRTGMMLGEHAFEFDIPAFETVAKDDEVLEWVKAMGPMLPLKRSTRSRP
jgi:hypothetical protein